MKLFRTKLIYEHHCIWKAYYIGRWEIFRRPLHEVTP